MIQARSVGTRERDECVDEYVELLVIVGQRVLDMRICLVDTTITLLSVKKRVSLLLFSLRLFTALALTCRQA